MEIEWKSKVASLKVLLKQMRYEDKGAEHGGLPKHIFYPQHSEIL